MIITNRLKERFCKDRNLSIRIFEEPYFSERIELFNKQYGCKKEYEDFCKILEDFENEEAYLAEYNKTKEAMMDYLRTSMSGFINTPEKFEIENTNIRRKDIYHHENAGKVFVSIDMKKANFSSLRYFNKQIFNGANTYEEFVGMFTTNKHFIGSKYIRQVVFGNICPSAQIRYEKYLMYQILKEVLEIVPKEGVVFFSNDEIVIDASYCAEKALKTFIENSHVLKTSGIIHDIDLRYTTFYLDKIEGIDGYIKIFPDSSFEIKSVNIVDIPFLLRKIQGEEYHDSDYIFVYDKSGYGDKLAKLLKGPEINFKKYDKSFFE